MAEYFVSLTAVLCQLGTCMLPPAVKAAACRYGDCAVLPVRSGRIRLRVSSHHSCWRSTPCSKHQSSALRVFRTKQNASCSEGRPLWCWRFCGEKAGYFPRSDSLTLSTPDWWAAFNPTPKGSPFLAILTGDPGRRGRRGSGEGLQKTLRA